MKCEKIATRSLMFTFDDIGMPTNVFAINGSRSIYMIDTYLGPEVMKLVHEETKKAFGDKPVIVVNTHWHWDHIWGNCYFDSAIIAHDNCYKYIKSGAAEKLNKFRKYVRGEVDIVCPNITFSDKLIFREDGLELFYTPGHTDDCISVFDMEDKVLYAGDNLERPLPYIYHSDLKAYVNTLEAYLKLGSKYVIGGHTSCESSELISDNLDYIRGVYSGADMKFTADEYRETHEANMESLKALLRGE